MSVEFELKRSSKKVTARSGLALFAEFASAFDLRDMIDSILPKPQSNRGIESSDYILTLLFSLYGGGESISDSKEIRGDFAMQELLGLKTVPSESATGDWLLRQGERGGIDGIELVNEKIIQSTIKKLGIKEVSLSYDPTLIKAEKRNAKMTYKGFRGYRPVFVFIDELKLIVCAKFKEGNDNGGMYDIVRGVIEKLEKWGLRVKHVSADSEYYATNILNYLMHIKKPFTIAVRKDSAVMEIIKNIPAASWKAFKTKDDFGTDREIAESVHTTNHGNSAFRIVVLRWINKDDERCYHCIATNLLEPCADNIVWKYNERADQENCIKEIKYGFGARKMPCSSSEANAMFLGIAVLTYNLFIAQKLLTMPKKYYTKTIKSIRWLVINTAGEVVETAKGLILTIFTDKDKFNLFKQMRRRIYALDTG